MQVTDSLRRIGHEFNQIVIDSANESTVHRSQAAELEARHRHLVAENDTFRANNEKLQRLLELSQPDPGGAIGFDGAAHRKLRHIRRVMRDLLEDLTVIHLLSSAKYVLKSHRQNLVIAQLKVLHCYYNQSHKRELMSGNLELPRPPPVEIAETIRLLIVRVLEIPFGPEIRERLAVHLR